MLTLSRILFMVAFAGYIAAAVLFVVRLLRRRAPAQQAVATSPHSAAASLPAPWDAMAAWANGLLAVSVVAQAAGIITRWIGSGQAPLSNMYEYMSFTGWSVMLFFLILNSWYRLPALGAFVAPVGVVVIAYASVFPTDVQPLIPALQSYWLVLHVLFAALGEGAFAVAFGAALMYLLRTRDPEDRGTERGLEIILFCTMVLVAFIALALGLKLGDYQVSVADATGRVMVYGLPPFAGPQGVATGSLGSFLGIPLPLFETPSWMAGVNAARKLNTLLVSLAGGLILYTLARLLLRSPLRTAASRPVSALDPEMLDEISYRGIAVGFPLFTLGALVFGMIWAQKAWGSYWSWDPKETWALISWLFYSGYLHMRIVRGWEGKKAAWVAVAGFIVILFTLVGVNLLISGLHSYA